MTKILRVLVPTALLATLCLGTATAQVTADGMGKIVPVEMWACNYLDGHDRSDLDRVNAAWNEWMDEHNNNTEATWILTPYFSGADQDFDFLWLSAHRDGNAFGAIHDLGMAEGQEVGDQFSEIIECPGHIGLSSAMYKSAPDGPDTGVVTMSNCTMKEAVSYDSVRAGEIKWAEYRTNAGSPGGTFHWFPTFGGGDQDFDYKIVEAFSSFSDLGANWEHNANRGGNQVSQEIFGELDDCDDARVYVSTAIRSAQIRD